MAENQVYLIKSGQNSFVEETEAVVGISGGKVGIGTTVPEADFHVAGTAQIDGDLTVKGNFTTVSETTVSIDDKNIELGVVDVPTDITADGGGITLKGTTDKTITWQNNNGAWNFSDDISVVGSGNFSQGLYVDGNSVLTGSAADLGKWDEGANSEIFYNNGSVGVGTSAPAYTVDVVGSGNFSQGLYVDGNSVLTGSADDLSKWTEGTANQLFYNDGRVGVGTSNPSVPFEVVGDSAFGGTLSVGSAFSVSTNGSIGGTVPTSAGQVITWDGLKWKPANAAAGGGGSSEVPVAFVQSLASGQSDYTINFAQTYQSVPAISTDLQIDGVGAIIPYAISNINTSGYTISFAKALPNNNYKIHTNFGGRDVYWTSGALGSISYSGGDVNIQNSLAVGANLTVQGNTVLTGSAADLGKWDEGAGSEIYYSDGNVGVGTSNPAYSLHVNGTIYNENGGVNIANKFNVSSLGAVGGQSPAFNEVIKWDGSKWIAGSAPGGGTASSSEVPNAFDTWLTQGSSVQAITFVDAPEGGYQSVPAISTDVEIVEGDIIPYAISGVSTTGYYAVFSDPIPTSNNYKIHTTFGGKEVYWKTGAGGSSIYYDGDSVSVDDLVVGGNLTVNGTTTTVNTETVEIEDHNLVIAANTGHNQLTAEYPSAGGAYAGILWGTGDAGAASPVSLTYQTNKGFAFDGGNVGIGTRVPDLKLHVHSGPDNDNTILESSDIAVTLTLKDSTGAAKIESRNDFRFSSNAGANEIMRLTSDGNVGIGTANPQSRRLNIHGDSESTVSVASITRNQASAANNTYTLQVDSSAHTSNLTSAGAMSVDVNSGRAFTINGFGNVGIGTTNPSRKLHVEGSHIRVNNDYGLESDGGNSRVIVGNAVISLETSNNEAVRINSSGHVGIGTTNPGSTLHILGSFGAPTTSNSIIRFAQSSGSGLCDLGFMPAGTTWGATWIQSRDSSNSNKYHLSLNPEGGNVGIGHTDPSGKLHVSDLNVSIGDVTVTNTGTGVTGGTSLNTKISDGDRIKINGEVFTVSSVTATTLTLSGTPTTAGTFTAYTDSNTLVVTSAGKVGIGTSNPYAQLTVANSAAGIYQLQVKSEHTSSGWGGLSSFVQVNGSIGRSLSVGAYRPFDNVNPCGVISFQSRDGGNCWLWMDDSNVLRFGSNSSNIGATGGTSLGTAGTSDERLKNIEDDFEYGLSHVLQLKPIAFTFKKDAQQVRKLGFGAQTSQSVVPESVYDSGNCIDGYDAHPEHEGMNVAKSDDNELGMEYVQLIPVLTKAIQEQQSIIESQDSKITQQQTIIDQLITRIQTLENK